MGISQSRNGCTASHWTGAMIYWAILPKMTRGYCNILLLQKILCIWANISMGQIAKCAAAISKGIPLYIWVDVVKLSLNLAVLIYILASRAWLCPLFLLSPAEIWILTILLILSIPQEEIFHFLIYISLITSKTEQLFNCSLATDISFSVNSHLISIAIFLWVGLSFSSICWGLYILWIYIFGYICWSVCTLWLQS